VTPSLQPPRLAEQLLRTLLPPDRDEVIVGDLFEEFQALAVAQSSVFARRWYWRQAIVSIWSTRGWIVERLAVESETAGGDVRIGLRLLARRPILSAAVIASLALGVGLNTATFSAVRAVLLKPLPFEKPEELVSLGETHPAMPDSRVAAYRSYTEWRDAPIFSGVAATRPDEFTLEDHGAPERVFGTRVSANYFDVIGVRPLLGRSFTSDDDRPAAEKTIALNEAIWRRRFAADPAIVGSAVRVDGEFRRVVAVMPQQETIRTLGWSDVWVPLAVEESAARRDDGRWLLVTARLAPGVTLAQAQESIAAIRDRLASESPESYGEWRTRVRRLDDVLVTSARPVLLLLATAVGVLLLLTCVNVAILLLSRSADRVHEFSVRAAIGASRGRLVRQLIIEHALLTGAGVAASFAVARTALSAIAATALVGVPRLSAATLDVDAFVAAMTIGAAAMLGFGVLPAVSAARASGAAVLGRDARTVAGAPRHRSIRPALVALQLAFATVLVTAAMLLAQTFSRLSAVPLGFDGDRVLVADIAIAGARYPNVESRLAFFQALVGELRARPTIAAAALVQFPPLGAGRRRIGVRGAEAATAAPLIAHFNVITDEYFDVIGAPLRRGRRFDASEVWRPTSSVIVSESLAERLWPGADPIGRRLRDGSEATPRVVVGVVGDVRRERLDGPVEPEIYFPLSTATSLTTAIAVRTATARVDAASGEIRAAVGHLDPMVPLIVRPQQEQVARALAVPRFQSRTVAAFAALALVLAVVGLYGVMAHLVAARRREFGIRLALGAKRRAVLHDAIEQGARLLVIGISAGVAMAAAGLRVAQGVVADLHVDIVPVTASVAVVAAVGLFACLVPACGALRLDVAAVLRSE
jgi:predicted permease